MPLTDFQTTILQLIAANRSPESHLAGATAIHASPASMRYSGDLDLFHDSEEAVARAYELDLRTLTAHGYEVRVRLSQPGYIRALVERDGDSVLIDWARDSAWRFMPPVFLPALGFVLHPVDLAVNKVLALGGRDEPRDWVDALYLDRELISLGALIFAAVGKDPGLNPSMLLEMLRRKGHVHPRDLERLQFAQTPNLQALRQQWHAALESASAFVKRRPATEAGHLYVHPQTGKFFAPGHDDAFFLHAPTLGGVVPGIMESAELPLSESEEIRKDLARFFGAGENSPV